MRASLRAFRRDVTDAVGAQNVGVDHRHMRVVALVGRFIVILSLETGLIRRERNLRPGNTLESHRFATPD
jgi:hypothetical protein